MSVKPLDRAEQLGLGAALALIAGGLGALELANVLDPGLAQAAGLEFAGRARVHSHLAWHIGHARFTGPGLALLLVYALGARRQLALPRSSAWTEAACVAIIGFPPALVLGLGALAAFHVYDLPAPAGLLLPLPWAIAGSVTIGVLVVTTWLRLRWAPRAEAVPDPAGGPGLGRNSR